MHSKSFTTNLSFIHKLKTASLIAISFLAFISLTPTQPSAGEFPSYVTAYRGSTPVLDGVLIPGEWDDAMSFTGTQDWYRDAVAVTDLKDLSVKCWVKHDGVNLYFAFDVTDDVIYGIDIDRWIPDLNPLVHEMSQEGWAWFGDSIEIMMNAENKWDPTKWEGCKGDGTSWQMVASTHKSWNGGIGVPGMSGGEPRVVDTAFNNYVSWIESEAIYAAVHVKTELEGNGYVIEWVIKPNPCLQVSAGNFWNVGMGEVKMGLNIEIQDVDEKERGTGNFANMHHIEYWTGPGHKSALRGLGELTISPEPMNPVIVAENKNLSPEPFIVKANYPNPFNPSTTIPFDMIKPGRMRIDVYSITGQHVASLLDSYLTAGQHSVVWNTNYSNGINLAGGIYLCRLSSGTTTVNKKMMFLK